MREMKHPNLISLIEVFESSNTFYLITPLYTGFYNFNLLNFLQKRLMSSRCNPQTRIFRIINSNYSLLNAISIKILNRTSYYSQRY